MKTHIFVSDIHMTDHEASGSVSDTELTGFTREVGKLSESGHVKLILLGDIIDFLRSPKWQECWDLHKSAPWSAMNLGFRNFVGNHAERYALNILTDVTNRYSNFAAALKELADSGKVEIVYVIGNHDYMLQLSPKLREATCAFLSLSSETNVTGKAFPTIYEDDESSVYATHGNKYEPTNHHRMEEGYWAFGDAVVLRLVNRFAHQVCEELGITEGTELGRRTHEIDNIEPLSDVPVYVRWLTDEFLTAPNEKEVVLKVWRNIVTELLDLPVFKDGYADKRIQSTRVALELSKNTSFSELVAKYASFFQGHNLRDHAEDLAATLNHRFRFIVFGHTHHPELVPLSFSVKEQQGYYVNTGCWHRVMSRPGPQARGPFAAVRVTAYFRIDKDDSGTRYSLRQECYTH